MNQNRIGTKSGAKWRENQDILSYVSKVGSISISEAEEILPGVSRRSIQRRLKQLVDEGYLELVGETREVKYILNQSGGTLTNIPGDASRDAHMDASGG